MVIRTTSVSAPRPTRGKSQRRIAKWLVVGVIVTGITVIAATVCWPAPPSPGANVNAVLDKLCQLREQKSAAVRQYFLSRQVFVRKLAKDPTIGQGLAQFASAWRNGGPDGDAYRTANTVFDKHLRAFAAEVGCYDLFLIDSEGNIVYTVIRENDFGVNVDTGPYRKLPIGRCFANAKRELGEHATDMFDGIKSRPGFQQEQLR